MSEVVAVIPTLGTNIPRLNAVIESVRQHTREVGLRIVVVNNSGVSPLEKLNPVDEVLTPGLNLGFVGALEWVRRIRNCEFLWIIQDDMLLLNDVLGHLLQSFEMQPDLGVTSPISLVDGKVPPKSRGGIFSDSTRTDWLPFPETDVDPNELRTPSTLSYVSSSGALFKSSALVQVGGFDLDLYPLICVDVMICARLLNAGYKLELNVDARISHLAQASTPKILAKVLAPRNRELALSYLRNSELNTNAAATLQCDDDIVHSVARRASQLFLDVGKQADTELKALKTELDAVKVNLTAELDAIQNSLSWRITRPLRSFGGFFLKLFSERRV